jgi:hypothetical protein
MLGRSGWCLLVAGFALLVPVVTAGQDDAPARRAAVTLFQRPASPPIYRGPTNHPPRMPINPPEVFGFPRFARAAGMIFSGTVTKIARPPATARQSVETVAVTFHVENALRGATPGQDLTVMQWIGLWSLGQRYRVGEHVLLFLYQKSKLGLTSWVGGPLGHFEMDRAGGVLLTPHHLAAFRKDPVLGGKSCARFGDFALAVRQAGEEE